PPGAVSRFSSGPGRAAVSEQREDVEQNLCPRSPGVQRNRSMSMRELADGNGPAVAIRDPTTGGIFYPLSCLFPPYFFSSGVLLCSGGLLFSAVLRASGGFRGPD